MLRGHMKLVVRLELSQLCLPHWVFLNRVGRPQNQVLGEKMKKCMSYRPPFPNGCVSSVRPGWREHSMYTVHGEMVSSGQRV